MKKDLDEFLKSATGLQLAYDTLKKSLPVIEKEKAELDKIIETGIEDFKNKIEDSINALDEKYKQYHKEIEEKEEKLNANLELITLQLDIANKKEISIKKLIETLKKEEDNIAGMLDNLKNQCIVPNTIQENHEQNSDTNTYSTIKYFYIKYKDSGMPIVLTKKSWTDKYCFYIDNIDMKKEFAIGKIYKNGTLYKKNEKHTFKEQFTLVPVEWITEIIDNQIKAD